MTDDTLNGTPSSPSTPPAQDATGGSANTTENAAPTTSAAGAAPDPSLTVAANTAPNATVSAGEGLAASAASVLKQGERDVRNEIKAVISRIESYLIRFEHIPVALADDLIALARKHI